MSDKKEDPWAEAPVIEREGYQLRSPQDGREEWRTILFVAAIIVVLSVIAIEAVGGGRLEVRRLDAQPVETENRSEDR